MARPKGKAEVEKKNQALSTLKIEYMKPEEVVPNPWNPNRQSDHDFDLLQRSMREDGFTQPIIVAKVTEEHKAQDQSLGDYAVGQLMIVDGEHRWRAGQVLGMEEVPVVVVPMDVAQMRIATLRHNRARGSEDIELGAQVLRDLEQLGALDWAQDSLKLDDVEVQRLLEDVPAPEALAAEAFADAWEPSKGEDAEDATLSDRQASSTAAAIERRRENEKRMAEARTEEERAAVRRDLDVYRFALTFAGDEAVMVSAVIKAAPAETVLQLCKEHLERTGMLDEVLAKKQEVLAGEVSVTPEEALAAKNAGGAE